MIPTCRRAGVAMLTLLLVLAVAPGAFAHTDLVESSPAAGATVDESLDEVSLTFAEGLAEDGEHAIGVYAPDGETRVDLDDLRAPTPESLAVSVGTLDEPGTYEVRWVIIADDGDEQRGDFTFEVTEGAATTPASESPTSTPTSDSTEDVPAATTEDAVTSTAPDDAGTTDDAGTETTGPVTDIATDLDTAGSGGDDGGTPVLLLVLVVAVAVALGLLAVRSRGTTRG